MDAPPIQHARTEASVHIAYRTLGEGRPSVQTLSIPASHLRAEWYVPAYRERKAPLSRPRQRWRSSMLCVIDAQ